MKTNIEYWLEYVEGKLTLNEVLQKVNTTVKINAK